MNIPLVSAIMMTGDMSRSMFCAMGIRCFLAQTWGNRELLIGHRGLYPVNPEGHGGIREVIVPLTEAAAWQHLMDQARGDIVIRWDDSGLSMPDRMRIQAAPIASGTVDATMLGCQIRYGLRRNTALVGWNVKRPGLASTLCYRRMPGYRYTAAGSRGDECFRDQFKKVQVIQGDRLHVLIHDGDNPEEDSRVMQDLCRRANIWRMDTSHDRLLIQAVDTFCGLLVGSRGHARVSPYVLPKDKIGLRAF